VTIVEVDYDPEIPVITADPITILTNATLQNAPLTPSEYYPNFTVTGQFNWTINTGSNILTVPTYAYLNLSMPADSTQINITSYGSNTTVVNVTSAEWIDDTILNVTLEIGKNDTYALLSLECTWNLTVTTDPATYQTTPQPQLGTHVANSTDVDYLQNFTIAAPFYNNITINVTLPEENVTIIGVSGNDTEAIKSAEYLWFTVYNVPSSGISPQIEMRAEKIIYIDTSLTTFKYREQGTAEVEKNVTWTSNYTITYNSTRYSNLLVENVLLNHTLWPDSDISPYNITVESGISLSNKQILGGTVGTFDGGYVEVTYSSFGDTNTSVLIIKEWTKAPTINHTYLNWTQNTSVESTLEIQYIYKTVNISNPSLENYTNVQWSTPCWLSYDCGGTNSRK